MFYVVVEEVGFCYIPTVTVTDPKGLEDRDAEVIALPAINKLTVTAMLNNGQAIETQSLEAALDLSEQIYKKLPRFRRQWDFDITTPLAQPAERHGMIIQGVGNILEEISEKYL